MKRWVLGALSSGIFAGAIFVITTLLLKLAEVSVYGPHTGPSWLQANSRPIALATALVGGAFALWAWSHVTRRR